MWPSALSRAIWQHVGAITARAERVGGSSTHPWAGLDVADFAGRGNSEFAPGEDCCMREMRQSRDARRRAAMKGWSNPGDEPAGTVAAARLPHVSTKALFDAPRKGRGASTGLPAPPARCPHHAPAAWPAWGLRGEHPHVDRNADARRRTAPQDRRCASADRPGQPRSASAASAARDVATQPKMPPCALIIARPAWWNSGK